MNLADHLEQRASAAHPNPTEAQKKAGNYSKGHVKAHGLDVTIENARGSFRRGIDQTTGKPWQVRMAHHYGYIKNSEGADGDHVDVYIGPHLKSPTVFVVDQKDADTGKWDEHKAFMGFASKQHVERAYQQAFSDGRGKERMGHITELTADEFKKWLKDGNTTKPIKRADGGRVEKKTHTEVAYVAHSVRAQHCASCAHFLPPSACEGVLSPISPAGWCIRYAAKRADGGRIQTFDDGGNVALPSDVSLPSDIAPPNQTEVAADIAKSAGVGVAKGGMGLVGLPGDITSLANKGFDWAAGKIESALGSSPENIAARTAAAQKGRGDMAAGLPTTSGIQNAVEGITGPLYKPQTTAGEYAQTAGEFLPAALAGPGSMARKVITQAAIPAVASETAGQLTKGTDAEPYARIATGLLSGAGATALSNRAAAAAAHTAIPTADELRVAARAGYDHPTVQDLEIKPAAVSTKADDIIADLNRSGFRDRNAPNTYAAVQGLKDPIGFSPTTGGTAAKVADFDSVRKELNITAGERNGIGKPTADAAAAQKAVDHIDDFLTNIAPQDVIKGDPQKAAQILQDARGNWSAASHMDDIDTRLTRADRQAAKAGTGSNIDNAIRQKISAVLDVSGRTRGYTPAEVAQMESVVRGTPSANLMRILGKFGVSGGLSLLLHAGMAVPTGGASIPIAAAGTVARKIGEGITTANANRITDMIGSRSPLFQQKQALTTPAQTQPLYNKALLNALLASTAAREQPTPISTPQSTQ